MRRTFINAVERATLRPASSGKGDNVLPYSLVNFIGWL